MKMFLLALTVSFVSLVATAASNIEGSWYNEAGGKEARFIEFNGHLTMNTRSYYSNGAPSDYFFQFPMPTSQAKPGMIYEGRMRSVDGYYGCLFDQPAKLQLTKDGKLKLNFPLLAFHRRTKSKRENAGTYYQRQVDWTYWGWVETIHKFPIYNWRVISTECIIDKALPTATVLIR